MDAIYGGRPTSIGREGALDSATPLLENTIEDVVYSSCTSPSEGHLLGLLTSGQRMESPGSRLIIKVTVILAEPVSGGLGFHHEAQLPERIPQSEDDRCVMVGCFAVGGASVEAYIRMLGCTLTFSDELGSRRPKDQHEQQQQKTHLETPGSKISDIAEFFKDNATFLPNEVVIAAVLCIPSTPCILIKDCCHSRTYHFLPHCG
ncbi:hypothetical protein G5714_002606 [Onychostoma macrolepis]|uniref:Uncharacterized protein n=1 Tax=Onychostoma macrolepis TaxID=369639 RepID=A0A7J6D789_9TELE|nr:hypothetical protein G5714_002606 [Onychostoma macrolepis]